MRAAALKDDPPRTSRLSTLVSERENKEIEKRAKRAGLSVSAYLRIQALGADEESTAAMAEFDRQLDRIESALDLAIGAVAAANAAIDARADAPPRRKKA